MLSARGRTLGLCCASILLTGLVAQANAGTALEPSEQRQAAVSEPLPADPSVVQGRLGNGLRFAIAPLERREGRRDTVSFVLQINAGSAFEQDDQIGAAKLASDIAARGGFSSDPEAFRRAADSFDDASRGGLRAYATFDTTRFVLTVPLDADETLSSADLGRIAETLAELIELPGDELDEAELDRSRRDLLAQQSGWSGPSQRITARALPALFRDSVFAERVPIYGREDLLATTPEAVSDFARAWYTPRSATLVVAGPIDPKVVQRAIEVAFGTIEAGGAQDGPDLSIGTPTPEVLVETDPAVASDIVQLMLIAPPPPPLVDETSLRERLAERVVVEAINRRLQDLSRRDGTAALQAGAFSQPNAGGYRMSMVNVVGEAGGWAKLTREAVASINSVTELGFTDAERAGAIDRVRASLEAEASSASERSAGRVASEIAGRIRHDDTIIRADQMASLGAPLLSALRQDDLEGAARRVFDPQRLSTLIVTADAPPTVAQVRHQIATGLGIDPAAVARATPLPSARPLIDGELEGGEVIELTHDASSGVTSATLSNGVRLHHRRMTDPDRAGRVEISVAILGGLSEQATDTVGLTNAIEALEWQPATRHRTGSEIDAAIGGRDIGFRVEAHPESVTFEVSTTEDDFDTAMLFLHALLDAGVIEPAAFDRWRLFELQDAASARTEPARVALTLFEKHVTPGLRERGSSLNESDLARIDADAVNAWLTRLLATGPLTATIVGDIDRDVALRLGAAALGGLPDRATASPSRLSSSRLVRFPTEMLRMRSEAPLAEPIGAVVVGFRSADRWEVRDALALDIASAALESRLRTRIDEDPRLAASILVWNLDGEYYAGSGRFWVRAVVNPADAEGVRELISTELARLVETGPTPEEVERARRSIVERAGRRNESARSWAEALARDAALGGEPVLVLRSREDVARSITVADVREALSRYSVPERSFEIMVLPRRD
jgi:zinc protease